MEYWSWRLFAIFLALQIVRLIRRNGVSVEQRRENLAGLGILLVLLLLSVLFGLVD